MSLLTRIKRYVALHYKWQRNQTKRIISFWEKNGPDFEYFNSANQKEWIEVFWGERSRFKALFTYLNPERMLEIACGSGRHSAQALDNIRELYLLDSSAGALALAKERFEGMKNVHYIQSKDGYGIPANTIDNNVLTAVFSYDAMVHFEKECVNAYLKDSYRVLQPGSYALFHHSNYSKNPGGTLTDNPGWRNYMTQELFISYASQAGFKVIQSEVFSFSCENSDCITLLQKV